MPVAALPEASGKERVLIADRMYSLTTLVERRGSDNFLVTVLAARGALFGMASAHTERGLWFSRNAAPGDVTTDELGNSSQ